jgi:putative acetyltransferase
MTRMEPIVDCEIRPAGVADVEEIAAAHLDSIRSIGPLYYPADIVNEWGARVNGALYVNAMARGEVFFIAVRELDEEREVVGFSSHRVDEDEHRTAVYVRGHAARLGIGSALFRTAEASAIASGAASLHVDASLAAVRFYKANGFEELGRGEHRLSSGRLMPCVFMRKHLASRQSKIMLLRSAPYFPVPDVEKASTYYRDVLGFQAEYSAGSPAQFAIVSRDGLAIMLRRVADPSALSPNERQGGTWDAFFWVSDVESLHDELRSKGADLAYGLVVRAEYHMKEFAARDPNGYVLGFGQEWPQGSGSSET